MVAQRFDANSTAGATVRNNCGLRVSFQVGNRAAVEFLHEGCRPDLGDERTHSAPGVALQHRGSAVDVAQHHRGETS